MRILVLGGTRFIGRAAVAELAGKHDIAVFHRGLTPAVFPDGVTELLGDHAELESHRAALLGFAADVVLDMIAFTEANATGLADLFSGHVPRLVVASSCDVY